MTTNLGVRNIVHEICPSAAGRPTVGARWTHARELYDQMPEPYAI
jgi:hypothetical protein